MEKLRILYKNLPKILLKEISKLKEYMEELKLYCDKQNTKLNELIEKTTNILQGYQVIECELTTMKKKVISIGEKITSEILKHIYNKNNSNNNYYKEINYIMNVLYDILKNNIDTMEDNGSKKVEKKYILLLLSFISETSNLNISKEIMENAKPLITKIDLYKNNYSKIFPEILTIIDFIEVLLIYYTKLTMIKKLYNSNLNKNNKMTTIQSDIDKQAEFMNKIKIILKKIIEDFEIFQKIIETKDKSNQMIKGYHIIEKFGLYEKYIVKEEHYNDYVSEYYNNYGGNSSKAKKFVISLNKKYRTKEKFIEQLYNCFIMYDKGVRKINLKKFINVINENRNTSVHNKNTTNANKSLSNLKKSNNNININISTNNILMKSFESNNSSANLKRSFQTQTHKSNSLFNVNKLNNSPFRNEFSRNINNNIFWKNSFVESYPNFDSFCKNSNKNNNSSNKNNSSSIQQKDASIEFEQTKLTTKTKNSVKSSKKNRNSVCINNIKKNQINLKFEKENWSICSYCCKNMENKIGEICQK